MPKRLPFFLLLLLQSASIIMPSFGTKLIFAEQLIDFSHLSSDFNNLEPPNCGNLQTASLILDIDLDGINDFVIAENSQAPSVVWYQRNPAGWKKHIIDNTQLYIEAGGAFCDIDNDLDMDIIFAGDGLSNEIWWWENPFPDFDPQTPWTRRIIKNTGFTKHHDQAVADIDNDQKPELISWNQGERVLFLFEIPDDPINCNTEWQRYIVAQGSSKHEGLAIEDIDLDGKPDIVGAARWYKHISGYDFQEFIIDPGLGQEYSRVATGQLVNGDYPEVVIVPGDSNGPLKWYQFDGSNWTQHTLLDYVIHGHTLQIEDINGDGKNDILVAEMSNPGHGDLAAMWIFFGDGNGNFIPQTISIGIPNHESKTADLDGDGDFDILSKPCCFCEPRIDIWINNSPLDPQKADLNENAWIDFKDFAIFANNWQKTSSINNNWCDNTDLDRNGTVNFNDLQTLKLNWLNCVDPPAGDINMDCKVNFCDTANLARHWFEQQCTITSWCSNTDIDQDGSTDIGDFEIFIQNWLTCKGPGCQ